MVGLCNLSNPTVPRRGKRRFSGNLKFRLSRFLRLGCIIFVRPLGVYLNPRSMTLPSNVDGSTLRRGWIDLERVNVDYGNVLGGL